MFQALLENKMTRFAWEVTEDGLCLCSYPRKNPEATLMVIKPHLYWYIQRFKNSSLGVRGRSSNVVFMRKELILHYSSSSTTDLIDWIQHARTWSSFETFSSAKWSFWLWVRSRTFLPSGSKEISIDQLLPIQTMWAIQFKQTLVIHMRKKQHYCFLT